MKERLAAPAEALLIHQMHEKGIVVTVAIAQGAPVQRHVKDVTRSRGSVEIIAQKGHRVSQVDLRRVLRFVARRYKRGSRQAIDDRVEETLALVGLGDKADRRVRALSGGELRRMGIAQAYVGHPDLLILDEPSVGLDPALNDC